MVLRVLRADPAGNITLFVLDPVPPGERGTLAARLMALPGSDIQQVGFRCPPGPGLDGRMEMAGGEFCGNATRAYGFLIARERGTSAPVRLQVSGMDHPVTVNTDLAAGTARCEMPLPLWIRPAAVGGTCALLVHLGGIAHLVTEEVTPSLDFFRQAEPLLAEIPRLDAYGVIFLNADRMTPLVKVPAAGSLVWEGSCGSGTLAAAIARTRSAPDGESIHRFHQPAGTVEAGVTRRNGTFTATWIGGNVSLGEPLQVNL